MRLQRWDFKILLKVVLEIIKIFNHVTGIIYKHENKNKCPRNDCNILYVNNI